MKLQFSGGTDRQRAWIQQAVDDCLYPLGDLIQTTVTVQWVDPLPVSGDLGHAHSYMVTQVNGLNSFTVSVAPWADDAAAPDNQGLPNPADDIYDFYKQSFVHELGHVVHFTFITTDQLRSQLAAQFWTPDVTGGSGVRYGTLADWSVSTWTANMMEAVAEVFKCAHYKGRLIFGNRTIWQIKRANWAQFMKLLYPTVQYLFADYSTPQTNPGSLELNPGVVSAGVAAGVETGAQCMVLFAPPISVVPQPPFNNYSLSAELNMIGYFPPDFDTYSFTQPGISITAEGTVPTPNQGQYVLVGVPGAPIQGPIDTGSPIELSIIIAPDGQGGSTVSLQVIPAMSEPYVTASEQANLKWVPNFSFAQTRSPCYEGLTWGPLLDFTAAFPGYPFGETDGNLSVSPGLRGAVRLG